MIGPSASGGAGQLMGGGAFATRCCAIAMTEAPPAMSEITSDIIKQRTLIERSFTGSTLISSRRGLDNYGCSHTRIHRQDRTPVEMKSFAPRPTVPEKR